MKDRREKELLEEAKLKKEKEDEEKKNKKKEEDELQLKKIKTLDKIPSDEEEDLLEKEDGARKNVKFGFGEMSFSEDSDQEKKEDKKQPEMRKTMTKLFNFREDIEKMKEKNSVDLVWVDFGKQHTKIQAYDP